MAELKFHCGFRTTQTMFFPFFKMPFLPTNWKFQAFVAQNSNFVRKLYSSKKNGTDVQKSQLNTNTIKTNAYRAIAIYPVFVPTRMEMSLKDLGCLH